MAKTMIRKIALAVLIIACAGVAKAWHDTMRMPVVERLTVDSRSMPASAKPVTIALISDIHVAGPDMPPERLARIVAQVNALKPDLIAIAGDLISEKRTASYIYTPAEAVAPLGNLIAPLGVVMVPGNHDHWADWRKMAMALAPYPNITVLRNRAKQVGPLVIGGVDDAYTGHEDLPATFAAMAGKPGARLILTHYPTYSRRCQSTSTSCLPGIPIADRSHGHGAARLRRCRTTAIFTPAE